MRDMYSHMEFQLSPTSLKPEIFTSIFQNIRLFTEHISITCNETGVFFQTMDSSRISIIEVNLPANWFDKYVFSNKSEIVLGISSNILFKILNAREKQQQIRVVYGLNDILEIHFTSEDKSVYDRYFHCPLLDIETDTMNIPDIDYCAEFTLSSSTFSTLIHQMKNFGDSLEMICNENRIEFTATSVETGTMTVEIPIDDLTSFSINAGEELRMSFALGALNQICSFNKVTKEIMIRLCDNYPLSIVFPITEEGAYLRIYLAPKITD